MNNYIDKCLNFIDKEKKHSRKELFRLLKLDDKKHNNEGQTINNAKSIKYSKDGSTIFSYPDQFTKIREDKKVEIYDSNKKKIGSSEVISIDYLNNSITLDINIPLGLKVLIIQSSDISPFAIVSSLKELKISLNKTSENLINRRTKSIIYKDSNIENFIKTVDKMNNDFLVLQGPPGSGKTTSAKEIINHLLKNKKRIAITSNSHSAINNLCEAVSYKKFNGAKICSRKKHEVSNEKYKNISVEGSDIDDSVAEYQLLAGTCFQLSKIKNVKYDFLIIDEASQLKFSFLLSVSRIANNVIILGDQNQLQSISQIEMEEGGESVLDYILQGKKIVPKELGYFLNVTYRMEPKIASLISKIFYEGKLQWNQTINKHGVTLISSDHSHGQKISKEEADDVLKIYKDLTINKNVSAEEIMVVTPYNAQVSLIQSLIKNDKTLVGTVDLFQGKESRFLIISLVSAGNKQESSEFATNKNRLNVAISRAKEGVFLIASKGLQESEHSSKEFRQILKLISE